MDSRQVNVSLENLNRHYADKFLTSSIILVAFILCGVLGNFAVMSVYFLRKNFHTYGRYFIPYLSAFDISTTVLCASLGLLRNNRFVTFPNDVLCKVLTYLAHTSLSISLTLLIVIAVQRYFLICRPFNRHLSFRECRILLFCLIVASVLFNIPQGIWHGLVNVKYSWGYDIEGRRCGFIQEWLHKSSSYRIATGVVRITEVFLLSLIYITIWRYIPDDKQQNKNKKSCKNIQIENGDMINIDKTAEVIPDIDGVHTIEGDTKMQPKNEEIEQQQTVQDKSDHLNRCLNTSSLPTRLSPTRRITTVLIIISVVEFLSFLPSFVIISLERKDPSFYDKLSPQLLVIYSILRVTYLFNHSANPVIYCVFDTKFRDELLISVRSVKDNLRGGK